MVFKIKKNLEKLLLGIISSGIIFGTPLYANAQKVENLSKTSDSFLVGSFRSTKKDYLLDYGTNETKSISVYAGKGDKSFKFEFGINGQREAFEKGVNVINLIPLDTDMSRIVVFYPEKTKIEKVEQEALILPQKRMTKLSPVEETTFSKKVLKYGEKTMDILTPIPIINPMKRLKEELIESTLTREEKEYLKEAKEMEKFLGEKYGFEEIPFFRANRLGCIEIKRRVSLYFDTREIEGTGVMMAFLKPAIGDESPDRTTGNWIKMVFIMRGEKLPSWIKKQEIGAESIKNIYSVLEIMQKRDTIDMGVYDDNTGRTILYSTNQNNHLEPGKKTLDYFLGIETDLRAEKFSRDSKIFIEGENGKIKQEVSFKKYYDFCRELENK